MHVDAPGLACPKCSGAMHVLKTFEHRGATLAHGPFRARETVYVCARGCSERADGSPSSRRLIRRPPELATLLLPRSIVGYDVMAYVGVQRFVHFRQREEIRQELSSRWGVELSSGEVSALARKFCVYLEALHRARAKQLRKALQADGGWPMHVDATGEDGRGTLLVVYSGWRGWVLGAWKIPTERAEAILPKLVETGRLFGPPCSLMRDLGRAVIEASQKYIASLRRPIPNLACHMHFVRDVGKDLLRDSHDALRDHFRRSQVVADLRALTRELGRKLGGEIARTRVQVASWLEDHEQPYALPGKNGGLAVVRALAQWTLDYPADGNDEGFPFDRPWYDLYLRCLKCCRAAEAFLARPQHDDGHRALDRLFKIVLRVRNEVPFGRQAAILSARARLLDDLRGALRLDLKPGGRNTALPRILSPQQAATELQDIETAVERLTTLLREQRPSRGPAQDQRAAIDLVLAHLDRHGDSLFGHLIALPRSAGGGIRVAERTNVDLEGFFHGIKRGERHRSGRKNLGQDLEHLPPQAALARNLRHDDYLDAICGGTLERLPAAFATLDEGRRDRSLPARTPALPDTEVVSSSMPTIDRRLVRTEAMNGRVQSAARSRSTLLG